MIPCKLPPLNIYVGGPNENIADVAEEMDTYLVLERDQEGRYLRDYEETTQNIVCAYGDEHDATILKYTGPDMSCLGSEMQAAIRKANESRVALRAAMSGEAAFCPALPHELAEVVVNLWGEGRIVITHCNDMGGEVAREVYVLGAPANVERIVEVIEDVSASHRHTREDIERTIQERWKAESQPSVIASVATE